MKRFKVFVEQLDTSEEFTLDEAKTKKIECPKCEGAGCDHCDDKGYHEKMDEAVKTTHVVIDTADDDKVVAAASSEKGAQQSINSAERPPMSIKNKKTLKIVKLKTAAGQKATEKMIGYSLKAKVESLEEVKETR